MVQNSHLDFWKPVSAWEDGEAGAAAWGAAVTGGRALISGPRTNVLKRDIMPEPEVRRMSGPACKPFSCDQLPMLHLAAESQTAAMCNFAKQL